MKSYATIITNESDENIMSMVKTLGDYGFNHCFNDDEQFVRYARDYGVLCINCSSEKDPKGLGFDYIESVPDLIRMFDCSFIKFDELKPKELEGAHIEDKYTPPIGWRIVNIDERQKTLPPHYDDVKVWTVVSDWSNRYIDKDLGVQDWGDPSVRFAVREDHVLKPNNEFEVGDIVIIDAYAMKDNYKLMITEHDGSIGLLCIESRRNNVITAGTFWNDRFVKWDGFTTITKEMFEPITTNWNQITKVKEEK